MNRNDLWYIKAVLDSHQVDELSKILAGDSKDAWVMPLPSTKKDATAYFDGFSVAIDRVLEAIDKEISYYEQIGKPDDRHRDVINALKDVRKKIKEMFINSINVNNGR